MNTVLTTDRDRHEHRRHEHRRHEHSRHEHPPQPAEMQYRYEVRRVGLADRIALHLGVALVKWGRRPLRVETRERRANRVEHLLARLAREHETERMRYLNVPRQ